MKQIIDISKAVGLIVMTGVAMATGIVAGTHLAEAGVKKLKDFKSRKTLGEIKIVNIKGDQS